MLRWCLLMTVVLLEMFILSSFWYNLISLFCYQVFTRVSKSRVLLFHQFLYYRSVIHTNATLVFAKMNGTCLIPHRLLLGMNFRLCVLCISKIVVKSNKTMTFFFCINLLLDWSTILTIATLVFANDCGVVRNVYTLFISI